MLNPDQQNALLFIRRWWRSRDQCMILDGAGGTGKSYLLHEAIDGLNCAPMFLCPTHEALRQLRDKVEGDYLFLTVHKALGLAPSTHEEDIVFEQIALPSYWDDHNLIIVDEASMLSGSLLDIILKTRKKVIFVGHVAQLPPVDQNRANTDKCVSPVFTMEWPRVNLAIPMRNTGELWEFNKKLEKLTHKPIGTVPSTFDITTDELFEYTMSDEGKRKFYEGTAKIALWTNKGADSYNARIRHILFGDLSKTKKYIRGDKILITQPLTAIGGLDRLRESHLKKAMTKKVDTLFSNTKAEVIDSSDCSVIFNPELSLECYKIHVQTDTGKYYFYELKKADDYMKIKNYFLHQAYSKKTVTDRQNAFKLVHFVLSLFANVKHCYAMTSHRLQGSSIDTVIVIASDIDKNKNMIERAKCRYVACSRAINTLMYYRGI